MRFAGYGVDGAVYLEALDEGIVAKVQGCGGATGLPGVEQFMTVVGYNPMEAFALI